jgi:hypothetical protein
MVNCEDVCPGLRMCALDLTCPLFLEDVCPGFNLPTISQKLQAIIYTKIKTYNIIYNIINFIIINNNF